MAYSNLRSKLNRAVVAHLIAEGCGTTYNIIPFLARGEKTVQDNVPVAIVRARVGKPRVEFSGNYDIVLHITVRGSAVQEVIDNASQMARLAFDDLIAKIQDALMQSDDGQSLSYTAKSITSYGRALATVDAVNDGDMDDFTCLSFKDAGFGDPNPNDQECLWEEVLLFEACCCASNIGGYALP